MPNYIVEPGRVLAMAVNPMSVSPLIVRQGTTNVAGFLPTDISGLVAWYDASRITGLSDGAAVATWSDLSGNGWDMTQGTAGLRPIYKINIVNGLPVVRFDGTDDRLTAGSPASAATATIFAVVKNDIGVVSVAHDTVFSRGSARHQLFNSVTPGTWGIFTGTQFDSAIAADTNWHVLAGRFTGDASSIISVDGVDETGNAGTDAGPNGMRLGFDGTGQFWDGDMAEIAYYSRVLNAAEMIQMEQYLAAKYNIAVS